MENKRQHLTSTPTWHLVKSDRNTLLLLLLVFTELFSTGFTQNSNSLWEMCLWFQSCCRMTGSSILWSFGWPGMTRGWWVQAGRGLGKLLISTRSYSVKNLSKHCESTAKLSALLWKSQRACLTFLSFFSMEVTNVCPGFWFYLNINLLIYSDLNPVLFWRGLVARCVTFPQ